MRLGKQMELVEQNVSVLKAVCVCVCVCDVM